MLALLRSGSLKWMIVRMILLSLAPSPSDGSSPEAPRRRSAPVLSTQPQQCAALTGAAHSCLWRSRSRSRNRGTQRRATGVR